MKYQVLAIVLGLSLGAAAVHAQEREVIVTNNRCERIEKIVEAVQCVEKGCPDPNGENKALYERICRAPEEGEGNANNGAEKPALAPLGSLDAQLADVTRDRYARQRQLQPVQPAGKLLSPCECLAFLDKRVKDEGLECPIELCKPPEEPKQPEQPQTPKDVTPEQPKEATGPKQFFLEGSKCSLGAVTGFSEMGTWLGFFLAASLLGLRRKK